MISFWICYLIASFFIFGLIRPMSSGSDIPYLLSFSAVSVGLVAKLCHLRLQSQITSERLWRYGQGLAWLLGLAGVIMISGIVGYLQGSEMGVAIFLLVGCSIVGFHLFRLACAAKYKFAMALVAATVPVLSLFLYSLLADLIWKCFEQ